MKRNLKIALFVLIILFSLLRFVSLESSIGPFYQGQMNSYISLQMAQGDIIYKDFQFTYPPLSYYLTELVFWVFGFNMLYAYIFYNLIAMFSLFLLYKLGSLYNKDVGLIAAFLLSITPSFVDNGHHVEMFALPFLLLSVYFIFKEKRYYSIFLSGMLISLAYFTKQTLGLFMIAAVIFFLINKRYKDIIVYGLGQCLVGILLFLYLKFKTGSYDFIYYLTFMLRSSFEKSFLLKTNALVQYVGLPIFILSISLIFYYLYSMVKEKENLDNMWFYATITGILFLIYIFILKTFAAYYFIPILPLFVLLIARLIFDLDWKKIKLINILVLVIILHTFAVGEVTAVSRQLYYYPDIHNEMVEVADYIKSITNKGDNVLIDNNAIVYYADRKKTGKLYQSGGIINTGFRTKEEILGMISNEKPQVIVILDSRLDWLEKGNYLVNYRYDKNIGEYRIYVLNQ